METLSPKVVSLTYCSVVASTWFFWDCCLTFNDELEFMWRRRWSYSLVLFLCIRYLTMALLAASLAMIPARHISEAGCQALDTLSTVGAFVLLIIVCIILQLRIYSMYGQNRRVLIINAVVFIVLCACSGIIVGVFFPQEIFLHVDPPAQGSCFVYMGAALSTGLCPPLLFSLYLTVLALWKWREYKSVKATGHSDALMALLVQSNVAYLLLLSAAIACVLYLQINIKTEPSSAAISLLTAAAGIGGTRLTLSLRKEVLTTPQSKTGPNQLSHPGTVDDRIIVHRVTKVIRDDDLDMEVFGGESDVMRVTRTLATEEDDYHEGGVYAQWLQLPGADSPKSGRPSTPFTIV